MDDAIKSLLIQGPMVVVLMYAIKVLYLDMKAERALAQIERQSIISKIDMLSDDIDKNTSTLARVESACGNGNLT